VNKQTIGVLTGALTAGFSELLDLGLNNIDTLKESANLKGVLKSIATSGLDTALHGGKLIENMVTTIAANGLGEALVGSAADKKVATHTEIAGHNLSHGFVTGTSRALLSGQSISQSVVAGTSQGVQAAVTGLAKHYGGEIAKQIPVQHAEQKNRQTKLTEQAITAQKEALAKAAAQYLQENNLNVPEGTIKASIEKHSVFKGNAADIEESLISLGCAAHEDNKNRNDAAQAIERGLSIVLRSTIKQLVSQTVASSTSTNAYQSNRQTQTQKPEQGPLITPNKTTTENKAKLGPRNSEPKTELPVNTVLLPFGKPSIYLSPAEKVNEDLKNAIATNTSNGPRVAQHNLDTPPRHSADDLMAQRRAINQSIHGSHYQEESCLATQFVGTLVGGAEKLASNTVELTKMGGGLLLDGLLDKDYMNVISPQMRQEAHVRNQERGTAILNAFKNIPNAPTLFKQHVEKGLHQASENIAAGNNFTAGKQLGDVGVEVVQVAATVLGAANLVTKGVQSGTQAVNTLATNTKKFIADNEFRSPIILTGGTQLNMGLPLNQIKIQNPVVNKELHSTINQAQRGISEAPIAASISDALRLQVELAFREADFLNIKGELTKKALSNIKILIRGRDLKSSSVIEALTKNGSNINDWGKYTTKSLALRNGQSKQIHFYLNSATGQVDYTHIDFKIKDPIKPFLNIYEINVSSPNVRVTGTSQATTTSSLPNTNPSSSNLTNQNAASVQNVFSKETQRLIDKHNKFKSQLFEREGAPKSDTALEAARIELKGEQIPKAIERGCTYNHIEKVQNAQEGLIDHIEKLNNRLSYPTVPTIERQALQQELSQTSTLLDYTEEFVPRPRPIDPTQPNPAKGPNL